MTRYRFIEAESSRYPVAQVCRIAQVSRAAYYAWKGTPASACAAEDAALTATIRAIHTASGGQYGVPRVLAELRAQGVDVGKKRVARLMTAAGLRGRRPRPTCCGSATSRTSARGKAGSTWRRCSMCSPAA